MLTKLIGYEMKAFGRIILPLYAATIGMSFLIGLGVRFLPEEMYSNWFGGIILSIFIVLIIAGTVVGSSIGGVLIIAGAVFGLAAFLSYLNSFGYIAKDIEAFIQKNLQEYANALNSQNQPEEGTDSLETEA